MSKMVTLSACDCVEVDGYLYFFSVDFNLLYKLEISTGEISLLSSIPEENIFAERRCIKLVYYKDYLYLAPLTADKIWRYCLTDGSWKGYELKKLPGYKGINAFCDAVLYDEKIFFIGCRYPAIVILDLNTDELQYCENVFTNHLRELADLSIDSFFICEGVVNNNLIYMASCLSNMVMIFNMDTLECEYVSVGNERNCYSGIGYDGSYFYLSPRKKRDAVRWDGGNGFENIEMQYLTANDDTAKVGVFCGEGKVTFFGMYGDRFKDTSNGICTLHDKYRFYKTIKSNTFVSLESIGNLTIKRNDEVYMHSLQVYETVLREYIRGEIKKRGGYFENIGSEKKNEVLTENDRLSLKLFTEII